MQRRFGPPVSTSLVYVWKRWVSCYMQHTQIFLSGNGPSTTEDEYDLFVFSWSPHAKQRSTGPSCCPRTALSRCTRLSASATPRRNSILTCMKEIWWLLWSKRTPLEAQADGLLTQEVCSLHKYPNNSFPLGYWFLFILAPSVCLCHTDSCIKRLVLK